MATTFDDSVTGPPAQSSVAPEPWLESANARIRLRRLAAGAVDAIVLSAGAALVLGTELAIASEEEVEWALAAWTLFFVPLYFGLYHAWELGGTPGQLELRLAVRDVQTHARPTRARALARSYLGLGFAVLVLPAAVDILVLVVSGRSLRDRITRTAVLPVALAGTVPELAGATVSDLQSIFEPPLGTRRYLRRGWALLRACPQTLLGSVAAVYGVFVAVLLVAAFLVVADSPDDAWGAAVFLVIAMALLASGVYWTQAVMVLAVEEVRVGARASIGRTLRRAVQRANALSAALVLLLALAAAACVLLLPALIAGRLALVVPALVLEDRRVLGAFRRSWELTAGQTWRALGLTLVSVLLLGAVPFAVDAIPLPLADGLAEHAGVVGWIGVAGLSIPPLAAFALVLAWLGAAWALVYEDARRRRPPGER